MGTFPVMENWHSFTEFNGAKPIYTCWGPSYCMRWIVHSFRMRELFDHALWSEWETLKARRWQMFKSILTQVKLNLVHNIFYIERSRWSYCPDIDKCTHTHTIFRLWSKIFYVKTYCWICIYIHTYIYNQNKELLILHFIWNRL